MFKGKKILITGGTGSIGQAIVEELLKYRPEVIRIMDMNETMSHILHEKYKKHKNIRFLLGDVRDKERLRRAMEDIDIVFHMASLKHVLDCEYNPFEAIKTNVIGTQNVIDVCLEADVERVVFTSSDKAVNPPNVLGATKLLAERLITAANYYKGKRKTKLSSVRFGNVMGTRGSVIPIFKNQIKAGGPVTVTDKKMTRFMMSPTEAVKLLLKCAEMMKGGEIFIFKMPVIRPIDLAEVMINEASQEKKIEIETVGPKPGEKTHEELMTAEESKRALETDDTFILLPEIVNTDLMPKNLLSYDSYNAKPAEFKNYSSSNVKPLTKEEIVSLLKSEGLL